MKEGDEVTFQMWIENPADGKGYQKVWESEPYRPIIYNKWEKFLQRITRIYYKLIDKELWK